MLIAATDPVAVIAAFKEMRVEPRLRMIVEAESLLNDGTAAVGFGVLVGFASGEVGGPAAIAASLAWTVLGGIASGGLVAGGVLLLANPAEDHLVEITLTTIAACGSFMLANHFGMSGVLASMTAGLIIGNVGMITTISEASRTRVLDFWEYAAFLANSIVFILIGSSEGHRGAALFTSVVALRDPARPHRPRGRCVPALHDVRSIGAARRQAAAARSRLGRVTGSAGAGLGPGAPRRHRRAPADHHGRVRGGGVLGHDPRPDRTLAHSTLGA